MEIQGTGGVRPPDRVQGPGKVARTQDVTPAGGGSDQVSLSETGRLLNRALQLPEVRQDRIEQVRQAIAAGKYETPEKLGKAVEAFLRDERG